MDVSTLRDAQAGRFSIARMPDVPTLLSWAARETPTLVRRIPDSSSSGSSATTTCSKSKDSDTCQKPVDNTAVPIALGVAVPLFCALMAFVYFHRRYKKKLRAEDAADEEKYKSMDFGMDLHYDGKKSKKNGKSDQQQRETSKVTRNPHVRGLSLEDSESPYFFRGGVRNSMESLRSLGNSIRHHQDPYHAHLGGKAAEALSIPCPSPRVRQFTDSTMAASIYEGHSRLLSHAQGSPRSDMPRTDPLPAPPDLPSSVRIQEPEKAMLASNEYASAKITTGSTAPTLQQEPSQAPHYHHAFGISNPHLDGFYDNKDQLSEPQATGGAPSGPEKEKIKVDSAMSTRLGSVASNTEGFSHTERSPPEMPPARSSQPATSVTSVSPPPQTQHVISNTAQKYDTVDKFNSIQGSVHDTNHLSYGQPFETQGSLSHASGPRGPNDNSVNRRDLAPNQQPETFEQPGLDKRTSQLSQESRSSYGDNNHSSSGQTVVAPMPGIREQIEPYSGGHNEEALGDEAYGSTAYDSYNHYANSHDYQTYPAEESPSNIYDSHGYNSTDYYVEHTNDANPDNAGDGRSRLSVFMRPLPPDDPSEDPEARANRIRSFYKEYFDDSKTGQYAGQPPYTQYQRGRVGYYEEYDSEYLGNGYSIYDERSGGFIVGGAPYAQPITRRAMTPPPRAPPRHFRGRPGGHNSASLRSPLSPAGSTASGYMTPPRAGSSMSNYSRVRAAKKNLPPPASLISLRTPALLKDDSALYGAFDLAPPPTFRQRQNGMRPDSPLGTERPYSPGVRVHTPLQSSFDELSPMPSPHLLRKSGTFTALDFAPLPRFRGVDTGSDAGSIRSGRSGMSNGQLHAMRAGAHRLSRLPKELAGTKDDITASLRPNWDMKY